MRTIRDGLRAFQDEAFPRLARRFAELARGQSPEVLFITCSDSRVDPSLITQTDPGEIFVLRNAGNLVPLPGNDDGSASAVEYAVDALRVRDIVVCGHSGCGAICGLMKPSSLLALPVVARWVEHAAPTRHACEHLPESERVPQAVRHNVAQQIENLKQHECVRRAMAEGRLELHGWVYDIPSGRVDEVAFAEDRELVATA